MERPESPFSETESISDHSSGFIPGDEFWGESEESDWEIESLLECSDDLCLLEEFTDVEPGSFTLNVHDDIQVTIPRVATQPVSTHLYLYLTIKNSAVRSIIRHNFIIKIKTTVKSAI